MQNVNITGDATINFKTVTGGNLTVSNGSTANIKLGGTNTMESITVENGSELITSGTGTLEVSRTIDNEGTVVNGTKLSINSSCELENGGTITNNSTIENRGIVNNKSTGTITNNGNIYNSQSIKE